MRFSLSVLSLVTTASVALAQDGSFVKSGTGCPQFTFGNGAAVYSILQQNEWNLDGRCFEFVQSGSDWLVTEGGAWVPLSGGEVQVGPVDDTVQSSFPLGFTFTYPGGAGSTTDIDVAPNGYIYLEAGTNFATRCCNASAGLADFLTATPSVAVLGTDLDMTMAGSCWFDSTTVGGIQVATVTWLDVPEWWHNGENTVQGQIWADGRIVICHQQTSQFRTLDTALVGVSAGGGVATPDIVEFNPSVGLRIDDFPNIASTVTVTADHVPATAAFAELEIGLTQINLPLDSAIGAPPGCSLLIDPILFGGLMNIAAPTASVTFPISNTPSAVGMVFELQAIIVDLTLPYPAPLLASDRASFTIGVLSNNNDCIGAIPIFPGVTAGDNLEATTSSVTGGCTNMGVDVWYSFVASCNGTATLSTCSAGGSATFDTVIAAFTGGCGALTEVGCNDTGAGCTLESTLTIPIIAGTQYYVAVGGWISGITGPRQGTFNLSVVETCAP